MFTLLDVQKRVYKASFVTWMQIAIGPIVDPESHKRAYLRCSDDYKWHSITALVEKDAATYKRDSVAPASNEIAPGPISVPNSATNPYASPNP